MEQYIKIRGAMENNLKNIDLDIPKNKLVVLTGLSGSGKSTLAFSTLQKECQRQYMESLGMVTDFISKPKVVSITGLSPSISVEQIKSNNNPRSTVGTVTDVFTYIRILFAKFGKRYCKKCKEELHHTFAKSSEEEQSEESAGGTVTCKHCGNHTYELTMSHFSFNKPEGACSKCSGVGVTSVPNLNKIIEKSKSIFDGALYGWDASYISRYTESMENAGKHYGFSMDTTLPIEQYDEVQMDLLLYGVLSPNFARHFPGVKPPKSVPDGCFEGVVTNLMRRYQEQVSASSKEKLEKLLIQQTCSACGGEKYKREIMDITLGGSNIIELLSMSLNEILAWTERFQKSLLGNEVDIAKPLTGSIYERVQRLINVGVGYLSLNRTIITLSTGEVQRLRLANILGSGLTGVLYVIDEPTVGLHASDNVYLLKVLKQLRDLGNTVLVVEHDIDIIKEADYVIDVGPGAGANGGEVIAVGTPEEVSKYPNSLTGKYLKGSVDVKIKNKIRGKENQFIRIEGATENNLKNVTVDIPLGKLVTLTGVSGAGKSTLIFDILGNYLDNKLKKANNTVGKVGKIEGGDIISDIIVIDQSSIGRSSRSNAATYTDIFTVVRKLFSELESAKVRGIKPNHFSFNVAGGRCDRCEGAGFIDVPMHFLPSATIKCPSCGGKRFKKKILEVKYNGYSISDVLDMSIDKALEVFSKVKPIHSKLSIMQRVGLGYLTLGQPAPTLSGGEAQRIRLSKELGLNFKNHVLYLLDEPSKGLHPEDAGRLILLLDELVNAGNSVILIEHNLDVIKASDWIIDLGPKGGNEGGEIIFTGTPQEIVSCERSLTGRSLLISEN